MMVGGREDEDDHEDDDDEVEEKCNAFVEDGDVNVEK